MSIYLKLCVPRQSKDTFLYAVCCGVRLSWRAYHIIGKFDSDLLPRTPSRACRTRCL